MVEDGAAWKMPLLTASQGQNNRDKEIQCGISEYVSLDVPGFIGLFKGRYTDFLVNEIQPNGTVVHLDNLHRPGTRTQARQPIGHASKESQSYLPRSTAPTVPESATPNDEPPSQPTRKGTPPHLRLPRGQQAVSAQDNAQAQPSPTKINEKESSLRSGNSNINEVEPGVRIRTKHVVSYDGGELRVVKDKDKPEAYDSVPGNPVRKQEGTQEATKSEGTQAEPSIDNDVEKRRQYDSQVGAGTVGGWQAFAKSNTDDTFPSPTQISQPSIVPSQQPVITGTATGSIQSQTHNTKLTLSIQDRHLLNECFDDQAIEQILELYRQKASNPTKYPKDFFQVRSTKQTLRQARFKLHEAVRRVFRRQLTSITDPHGFINIAAAFPPSQSGNNARGPNTSKDLPSSYIKPGARWAALGGDHVHFSLCKENKEHNEALSIMTKLAHIDRKLFKTAGTKDRRGLTVQRVSVYRVEVGKLIQAGDRAKGIWIGNYEFHPQGLQDGDLRGNQFEITLRDCHFSGFGSLEAGTDIEQARATVDAAVNRLLSHGFLNYYGLQRFGTYAVGTHVVGRYLLQGDFRTACHKILFFDPNTLEAAQQGEDPNTFVLRDDKARALALHMFLTTGDSKEALAHLPFRFRPETSIIRHLSQRNQENDFQGAMATIERGTLSRYTHAYQGIVWNVVASARWRLYGHRVMPGDLVLVDDHPDPARNHSAKEVSNDTLAVDQDGEPIVEAKPEDRAYNAEEIFERARHITESELNMPGCEITIFDIVLPLPGYDVLYPANATGQVYKDYMCSMEGGHLDPLDMRRNWRDISLAGAYRKFLARPLGDIEWGIKAYGSNGEEQFVETDLDRLGIVLPPPRPPFTHHREPLQPNIIQQDPPAVVQNESPQSTQPKQPYASWDIRPEDPLAAPVSPTPSKRAAPPSWLDTSPNTAWKVESNNPRRLIDVSVPNNPAPGSAAATTAANQAVRSMPAKENEKPTYASWDVRSEDQSSAANNGSISPVKAPSSGAGNQKPKYASWDVRSEDQRSAATNDSIFVNVSSSANNESPELAQASASASTNSEPASEGKNDKSAVIMKMRFGSGVYATMALRELMKEGGLREYRGGGGPPC
ncbi:MAG: hypothetical protein LQ352_002832 [Teloschistes flavicans]|nr:MAG: hypothetical protein LQ352_002832 [Teloschistes flavicans]